VCRLKKKKPFGLEFSMGLGSWTGLDENARLPEGQEGAAIACGGECGRQEGFSETYGGMGIDTGIYWPGARPLASRYRAGQG